MKEIKLNGLDLSVFTETLDNGLDVLFVPYKNKKNYFISYATKFGSEVTSFTPIGASKEIRVPDGIAHFLEHKMFEQEDGVDPFSYFSESGTGSNASTSFDNTQYICYGTKDFKDNLEYLLKFVNSPYYTDENVLKEKGIIYEELKMYDDIPDFQLEKKLRENIFHVLPRRVDIGGTIDSVSTITKEDLYTCYNSFYVPSNMFILVVGNFPMKDSLDIIKDSVSSIPNKKLPVIKKYKESSHVLKKYEEIVGSINVDKLGLGLKVFSKDFKYDDFILDLYLTMFTTICFGSASDFREKAREEKLLKNFYTEWETMKDFKVFYIMASVENIDILLKYIKEEFKNLNITVEAFNRVKKVWIANEVKMIDYIDSTVHNIYDDYLKYGKVIPDKIDIIRNLSYDELLNVVGKIDFNNISVVKMKSDKEV